MTTEPGRGAPAGPGLPRGPVRRSIRARRADVIDVFVYVVVLNLAIEYVPSVISEGFTLSLLTAVLLKIALEVVIAVKNRIIRRLRAATSRRAKVAAPCRCGWSRQAARWSCCNWSISSSVTR